MAQMTIRNLDDAVYARLKAQASTHGRSLEAEARQILESATRPQQRDDFAQRAQEIRAASRKKWKGDATAIIRAERLR
jgi:plasmid stability protein